jgi:hypothetical protein
MTMTILHYTALRYTYMKSHEQMCLVLYKPQHSLTERPWTTMNKPNLGV